MVIIFSLLMFVAFHYRANKYSFETLNIVNDYVFIDTDSDIENLISVLLLASLPEKEIAVCTSSPLGYRDSIIHNSQH